MPYIPRLTAETVRWHWHPDDRRSEDTVEGICCELAELFRTTWRTVKSRAADNRATDPALHRLMANLRLTGLDVTADGCVLSLWVSGRGSHDLLHARTGERMTAALTEEARTEVRVADCDSRLRWTNGIPCSEQAPLARPVPPDPEAVRAFEAHLDAVVEGIVVEDGPQAGSERLLLALERRLGFRPGAYWGMRPDGMVTLRCAPDEARRLLALGVPAKPSLDGGFGVVVAFTLTDRQCREFADVVAAHS
ncbi:hypothetical protein EV284_6436 [Streptomyces sp. BK022]|uniref:hypothetical protein n=1 Tax=Streptomyces sp. BK022 TaxID=2512123 RepID=UPI00102A8767|nr:hypothetical protein [Streptomyces sp. BK022]RZU28270.1 hypothetical protein EV284_6436 [Streptomyces sp. BK022]